MAAAAAASPSKSSAVAENDLFIKLVIEAFLEGEGGFLDFAEATTLFEVRGMSLPNARLRVFYINSLISVTIER